MRVKHLIFAGGGTRGLCYAAAYHELLQVAEVEVTRVSGTSIGSLMATLVACKYAPDALCALAEKIQMHDIARINLFTVFEKWGLDDGQRLQAYVDDLIRAQTGRQETTFAQLYRDTGIYLQIITTNITTASECVLNHETSPNMPVCLAVRQSMALPPLFAPVRGLNDHFFIDGGVMNNYPYECMPEEHTVGFRIEWTNALSLDTIDQTYSRIVYVAMSRLSRVGLDRAPARIRDNTIHVDGGDISTVNLQITPGMKAALNQRARTAVRAWAAAQ